MKPCTRIGVDLTWKCQAKCRFCFYLRDERFHSGVDVPLSEVTSKINRGIAGGCDAVVAVGFGEPALYPHILGLLDYCRERGLSTSMITNGFASVERYRQFFEHGLDHVHLSSHGLGDTMDLVMGFRGGFERQAKLKDWLTANGHVFRTNVTLQQENYRQLPQLAEYEVSKGDFHFVFLGFLPHLQWLHHECEIAVHPAELRPYIEAAADVLLDSGTLFTIRYHPYCHLRTDLWKYVVNTLYCQWDNTEWIYTLAPNDPDGLWQYSVSMNDSVAHHGEPCNSCLARQHCGAINKRIFNAFDGAGLEPIREMPDEYKHVWHQRGGLHDMNPATCLPSALETIKREARYKGKCYENRSDRRDRGVGPQRLDVVVSPRSRERPKPLH